MTSMTAMNISAGPRKMTARDPLSILARRTVSGFVLIPRRTPSRTAGISDATTEVNGEPSPSEAAPHAPSTQPRAPPISAPPRGGFARWLNSAADPARTTV